MQPSQGRIVLVKKDGLVWPAIVTRVYNNTSNVDVIMFQSDYGSPAHHMKSLAFVENVEDLIGSSNWTWPPRV